MAIAVAAYALAAEDPPTFETADGVVLSLANNSLQAVNGHLVFSSTISNPSQRKWTDVSLDIWASFACAGGQEILHFVARAGDIGVGDTKATGPATALAMDGCRMGGIRLVQFKSGEAARDGSEPIDNSPEARGRAAGRAEMRKINERIDREHIEKEAAELTCHNVYRLIGDKKVSELTIREESAVRSCQKLGYEP